MKLGYIEGRPDGVKLGPNDGSSDDINDGDVL